jgi:hypothetical protein
MASHAAGLSHTSASGCDGAVARTRTFLGRRMWEHLFVTSQGSPYGRLRRALDSGNATVALAAASEMPTLGLIRGA